MNELQAELQTLRNYLQQLNKKQDLTIEWVNEALNHMSHFENLFQHVLWAHLSETAQQRAKLQQLQLNAAVAEHQQLQFRSEVKLWRDADQALLCHLTNIIQDLSQKNQETEKRLYDTVREVRSTSRRARNIGNAWVDQEMEEAPSHPAREGTYAAPDEEDDDDEYSQAPEPEDPEQDPQEPKGQASRPQRAEKGKAPAGRPRSHGANVPSPSPTGGANGSGDGNGNRGPPKNPHGKRTRSPSPPSSPSSSSSDSGLSDAPRWSIKRIKCHGTTPLSRSPSHPPAVLSRGTPAVKETPCPDPKKFDLKGDHQPFIRAC